MFNRDHLIIGAVGFVLGGVVATASITAVLMTQTHDDKVCPPIPAIIAPPPAVSSSTPAEAPPAETGSASGVMPAAQIAPTPVAAPVAKPAAKLSSLEAEEKDRLTEEQKQLLERKKNLTSQLNDSNEIIRLKEQQIKEMEAQLKQQP